LQGRLLANAKASASEGSPDRSSYRGTLHFFLRDEKQSRDLIDFTAAIEGKGNEPPGEAVWRVFHRYTEVVRQLDRMPATRATRQGATERNRSGR